MPHIDWQTARIDPEDADADGPDEGRVVLMVEVRDASRQWAWEFNSRTELRDRATRGELPWGMVVYVDGCLIVDDLMPADLDALDSYLQRIWPDRS